MLRVIWSCFLVAATGAEGPSSENLQTYRAEQAKVGRDADAHVRLALWCESRGLTTERIKHLVSAVLIDPNHSVARGLMGLVRDGAKWRTPEDVTERVHSDAETATALAEYQARRARTNDTAEAHWRLALWCEENDLLPEAKAHLGMVVRLDPDHERARKHLGYKKYKGRWVTGQQLDDERAEAEAQRLADKVWTTRLTKWRDDLKAKDPSRGEEAQVALAQMRDPRAVPSIVQVFNATDPERAAQLLGQGDAPSASRALALLAVLSPHDEARRTAAETLVRRDPFEYAHLLIGFIRKPIRYEAKPVGGPGSPGVLLVEGQEFNLQRVYAPPPVLSSTAKLGYVGTSINGQPLILRRGEVASFMAAHTAVAQNQASSVVSGPSTLSLWEERTQILIGESFRKAAVAEMQLENDVARIEAVNQPIHRRNRHAVMVLTAATGMNFGEDPIAWHSWWTERRGYRSVPTSTGSTQAAKPTVTEQVPIDYQPILPQDFTYDPQRGYANISCFAAGTPVHTLGGLRPIEELCVGDRVLAQDTATGSLNFQPVMTIYHNPPGPTLKVALGDETLVASTFHRFWRAGRGWAMAKDLRPGDVIRARLGLQRVLSVEPGEVLPVYNLDVAESRTFFVGRQGALVHDNSVPERPGSRFDAPAADDGRPSAE